MIGDNLEIKVLRNNENDVLLEIYFANSSGFFDGHFPEFPLLPGVVQSHLAIKLFEKYQNKKISFSGFKSLKFFSPIFPDTLVHLELKSDTANNLNFQYLSKDKHLSRGIVVVKDV